MAVTNVSINQLLKGKEGQLLNKLTHCNFINSLIQFLHDNGLTVAKEEIIEGEKENYIGRDGSFKYKNTLKLKEQGLKIKMSCLFKNEWEFYLDEIMKPHLEIKKEKVIVHTAGASVLVRVDEAVYLVPISVAEKLDLEEFDGKTLEPELKKMHLHVLKEFELNNFISFK